MIFLNKLFKKRYTYVILSFLFIYNENKCLLLIEIIMYDLSTKNNKC